MESLKDSFINAILERMAVKYPLVGYDRPSPTNPTTGSVHIRRGRNLSDLARMEYGLTERSYFLVLETAGASPLTTSGSYWGDDRIERFLEEGAERIRAAAGAGKRGGDRGAAAARPPWRAPIWCIETGNGGRVFIASDDPDALLKNWPFGTTPSGIRRVDEGEEPPGGGHEPTWLLVEELEPPADPKPGNPGKDGSFLSVLKGGQHLRVSPFPFFPTFEVRDGQTVDFQFFPGGSPAGIVWVSSAAGPARITMTSKF